MNLGFLIDFYKAYISKHDKLLLLNFFLVFLKRLFVF